MLGLAGCSDGEVSAPSRSSALQCTAAPLPRAPARLLTRLQYDNTVRDLLGDVSGPSRDFPPENQMLGFDNNADAHQASPLAVEKYLLAAEALARTATEQGPDRFAPCASGAAEDDCGKAFILEFGRRAFRRPVTEEEAASFGRLFSNARQAQSYPAAVTTTIEAMLQSPQFLYRFDGYAAPTPETGAIALGSWEMASRLSYFLWNTMPDAELFRAADAGELDTAARLEAQARRMLADPRARASVRDFHRQWLSLDRFQTLVRDSGNGELDASTLAAARASLEGFVDHAFWEDGGTFGALFSSNTVFVDDKLAPLFGLQAASAGAELAPVQITDGTRAGLLTQPALMALLAHPDQSSPIQRGVFVREQILCDPLQPAPPNVDQTPPDPDPNATTRERFAVHTQDRSCAGCHQEIDPIGFGFENYDQLGQFRSEEHGRAIDSSGAVVGLLDAELDGPFLTPIELSHRIANSARARDCLATHWYRYATGRAEGPDDTCSLDQVKTAFGAANGDLRQLLISIVLSDSFRYRAALALGSP
jgi:hypothetical protein